MFRFEIGELVWHGRYHYRGVVIARDECCEMSDAWYRSNRTQPDRNRPWYHVLVHEGRETYVAEANLQLDTTTDEVDHPYVRLYFPTFSEGRYHRQSLN